VVDFDDDEDRERGGREWIPDEEYLDRYVEGATAAIRELIEGRPDDVFYERQLQVLFEGRFYHWITSRALKELVQDGLVQSEYMPMGGRPSPEHSEGAGARMRFFFSNKLRYWTRKAKEVLRLVQVYSEVEFTNAFGHHAEMLFDAALPKAGFIPVAQHAREFGGRRWEATDHDLDRIFVRDGIAYGAEIKNRLAYIDGRLWLTKLRMCRHLGLRPLFIVRMMPKSYIYTVNDQFGGFCLIFKFQLYPFGAEALAKTVRERLGLPIDCPQQFKRARFNDF
jgi:hypothetical protein